MSALKRVGMSGFPTQLTPSRAMEKMSKVRTITICTQIYYIPFLLLKSSRRARAHSVCTRAHFFSGVIMHGARMHAIKKYVTRTYNVLSLVHIT